MCVYFKRVSSHLVCIHMTQHAFVEDSDGDGSVCTVCAVYWYAGVC